MTKPRLNGRMPSVRANDEVCPHFQFAARSFCAHADHARILRQQIDDFCFHVQLESRELFGVTGEKIKKIPLRHERDKFAMRWKLREIGDRHGLTVNYGAQFSQFLMRLLQKL